ncbi:MAG: glycosyltransferase [Candidatus Promineifilaceae bacterium]
MKKKPRILLYSHDTYGLGHLRRSLSIAEQIASDIPNVHQLLLTGSMVAGAFALPPRLDMIKLPAISKRSTGQYKTRTLPLTLKQTLAWREQIILQAAVNFKPDLLLVDKVAAGVHGELLPTLRHLKTWFPQTKVVLGMRDIEDSPAKTKQEWLEKGTYALLDDVYDQILFYGQCQMFNPVTAYEMSDTAASKLIECGYIRREKTSRTPDAVRRELGIGDKPLVVVTVGGGGDGFNILKNMLDMLAAWQTAVSFHTLLVTGPLMPRTKQQNLHKQAGTLADVTLIDFTPDLTSYLNTSDLIISMAGYNTTCEILSMQKRAILIPRARVRAEQRIRATHLAKLGIISSLLPDQLTPDTLWQSIQTALQTPPPTHTLNMNGLSYISRTVAALLNNALAPHANGHIHIPAILSPKTQPQEVSL